jgi:spore maturation protein CgeB
VPWYADNRDLPQPPWGETHLYGSVRELRAHHAATVRAADLVVLGSYVPEGVAVGEWLTATATGATAFYDIDTPVTVAKLEAGDEEYLSRALVPRFDTYLSFTGGPLLERLEDELGARHAEAFYCFVDPEAYPPRVVAERWLLGYLGTYSADRQPQLEKLLLEPARRLATAPFAVAGPQYPHAIAWPENVERIEHLPPAEHPGFYCAQRATLNVTRVDMRRWGWSPSVRLFEAAACGVAVISDRWAGIETFFEPGRELLLVDSADDVVRLLQRHSHAELREIGARARARVLDEHTAARRADRLEELVGARSEVAA